MLNVKVNPGTALLGDFNGDGKLDVVMTGNAIAFGNGDGTFGKAEPIVTLPESDYFVSVAVADLNGDGKLDIVGANPFNDHNYFAFNQGDGTFALTILDSPEYCGGSILVTTGDLNLDGNADVVFSCNVARLDLYLSHGDGTFTEEPLLHLPGVAPGPVVIADFNGDGIPDLGVDPSNTFGVYLGNGDGTFQDARRWFGVGPSPQLPLAMNLHGQSPASGFPDVVVPDATGLVGIFINTTAAPQ